MKRIISLLIILSLFSGVNVYAKAEKNDAKEVIERYGLKAVDQKNLPKDITPLEMTIEEFEEFMHINKTHNKSIEIVGSMKMIKDPIIKARSFPISTKIYMDHSVGIGANIQTYADLTYMDGSSIVMVDRVRSKLGGFQVGLSLTDVETSYSLYDGAKTIIVTSYYTLNNVIFVEGIGVIYSVDFKGTLKWNTLTGYLIRQVEVLPK